MRAMVMAAGLGTRLRPITHEVPKPVVPVGNVAIVEQLVRLLGAHGVTEVIANLHWFPGTVRARLGDGSALGVAVSYEQEQELLGTAGGVRNVRDFLTAGEDDLFLVLAGDALTDIDLSALVAAHRANGGVATLAVKPHRRGPTTTRKWSAPAHMPWVAGLGPVGPHTEVADHDGP